MWLDGLRFYFKRGKRCFKTYKTIKKASNRILFSGLSSNFETWKLESIIKIRKLTKKKKTNKTDKILQLQEEIRKIRINYFSRTKNDRGSN